MLGFFVVSPGYFVFDDCSNFSFCNSDSSAFSFVNSGGNSLSFSSSGSKPCSALSFGLATFSSRAFNDSFSLSFIYKMKQKLPLNFLSLMCGNIDMFFKCQTRLILIE